MAWREEEHPRDEDGKFTDKSGDKKSSVEKIKGFLKEEKHLQKARKRNIIITERKGMVRKDTYLTILKA